MGKALTRFLCQALAAALILAAAGPAHSGPDLGSAAAALVATPFRVAGDLVGTAGLTAASVVGLLSDGIALIDANRYTTPVLRGIPSGLVRRVALALSQGSTGLMEGLRAEDVERLPEPSAAYLQNAPGAGRLDTLFTGLGSLRLAFEDALGGPALVILHVFGANETARWIADGQRDERIRVLGPLADESETLTGSTKLDP